MTPSPTKPLPAPARSPWPFLVAGLIAVVAAIVAPNAWADGGAPAPPAPPALSAKAALLERLRTLNRTGQWLFGQENATLWGMSLDGQVVSTKEWYDRTAAAGKFTSDSAQLVGDDPAVLEIGRASCRERV